MDAVQQAKSGHPGTPMALAPLAHVIWQHFLGFDSEDPIWPNRPGGRATDRWFRPIPFGYSASSRVSSLNGSPLSHRSEASRDGAARYGSDFGSLPPVTGVGRSTRERLDLIDRTGKTGAAFRSLGDPLWDTSSAQGRLLSMHRRRSWDRASSGPNTNG
jgi:Transketolase, thiamine diphosphate binding domain